MALGLEDVPWMLMNLASDMATALSCKHNKVHAYDFKLFIYVMQWQRGDEFSRFHLWRTISRGTIELVNVNRILDISHVEVLKKETICFATATLHQLQFNTILYIRGVLLYMPIICS
jgi:hypothetical protein